MSIVLQGENKMSDKTTKIEDAAELAEIVDIPKAADPDVCTHTFRKPVTYMGAEYADSVTAAHYMEHYHDTDTDPRCH
jgi:hypothetical protein